MMDVALDELELILQLMYARSFRLSGRILERFLSLAEDIRGHHAILTMMDVALDDLEIILQLMYTRSFRLSGRIM